MMTGMAEAGKKRKIFDGRYEILGIVGRGSKSVVYHAQLINPPHEQVAIKVLINSGDSRATRLRLRNEALCMVTAQHPYVLRLNDFHSVEDLSYLSLEYAPLADLRKYIGLQKHSFSYAQADKFFRQLSEALYYLHSVGILHRDIKPDNILVINDDEIRLGDFGTAIIKGEGSPIEDLKNAVGTMNYLAPEVLKGESYDHRADIYSLGLTFYEALMGKHPFESAPMAQQLDIRMSKLPPLKTLVPELPEFFSKIIERCLEPDINQRYNSAKDIIKDLNDGASEKPTAPIINYQEQFEESLAAEDTDLTDTDENEAVQQPGPDIDRYPLNEKNEENLADDNWELDLKEEDDDFTDEAARTTNILASAFERGLPVTSQPKTEQAKKPTLQEHRSSAQSFGARFNNRRSKLAIGVAAAAFAVFIISNLFGGKSTPIREVAPQPIQEASFQLPQYSADIPSFPSLPEGVYVGSISNLLDKSEIPLTLISLPDEGLVAFLGIEGWTPTIATKDLERNQLRIASNGYVLRFTGEVNSDTVFGTVTHVSSGKGSSWSVSPVKSLQ